MGTIKVAVLSVIIGVMAGGASALAVIAWVPSLFPQLDPTTLTAHITQAAAAGRGVELAPELWTKTRAAHVFIFAKTTQPQGLLTETPPGTKPITGYMTQTVKGIGMFITSDGWLVTPSSIARNPENITLVAGGKELTINKVVHDTISRITFIKVDGDGYPIVPIANASRWLPEYWWTGANTARFAGNVTWRTVPESAAISKKPYSGNTIVRWPYIDAMASDVPGQTVLNSTGELVGLLEKTADNKAYVVPLPLVTPVINRLFLNEPLTRAEYPFNYYAINEWSVVDAPAPLTALTYGALVHDIASGTIKNASLQPGDVIVDVEGISLEGERDIGLLLATYADREHVRLKIIRNGETQLMSW